MQNFENISSMTFSDTELPLMFPMLQSARLMHVATQSSGSVSMSVRAVSSWVSAEVNSFKWRVFVIEIVFDWGVLANVFL